MIIYMKHYILLLEDDKKQADALEKMITNYSSDIYVTQTSTFLQAAFLLENKTENYTIFDAFFLDISLDVNKNEEGLILADKIRSIPQYHKTPLIFTTAFPEHIRSAVNNTHCFAYLIKPYTRQEVHRQLDALFKYMPILTVKTLENIHIRLPLDTLQYIKANGRYLDFITVSDRYRSRQYTLNKLIKLLPDNFVHCHKSYIINKSFVNNFDFVNCFAHLSVNNEIIPLSRSFHDTD